MLQIDARINDLKQFILLYYTNKFKGELTSSDEGEVIWLKKEDMNKYQISEGLEELMDLILKNK